MKTLKKLFFLFIIIITLYILWLFIFSEKVRNFWDSIWLKSFNDFIINLKNKSDWVVKNEVNVISIKSGAQDILDNASNYAKDVKWKIDGVRKWAQDIEKTYNDVKKQVDETTKTINDFSEKINETKDSVNNFKNIFN